MDLVGRVNLIDRLTATATKHLNELSGVVLLKQFFRRIFPVHHLPLDRITPAAFHLFLSLLRLNTLRMFRNCTLVDANRH